MAFCNQLNRLVKQRRPLTIRSFSAEATHHRSHQETHSFLEPESYIGSWEAPKDPKDAERMLARIRREYAKKVSMYRREYVHEIEMLRVEKQRKDEARLLAERAANEERRRLKAEAAKVRAEERKVFEEEFRRTLRKEREEKLEFWRMTGLKREEKKKARKKLLHEQSSLWIEPKELEKKITEALVDSTTL
ncbi:Stress response NST1-like protein [Hirschfeldia incana]|nr:Stress response NST1-like protein [Hirschfeldia incana]KAJ0253887.1 Stress response NST1-like protein [Hirschfeldia incana]